jgi:hypothetical protein
MVTGSSAGFFIADGVRRSVATREAGVTSIEAVVIVSGQPDVRITLNLDQLFSPKGTVAKDARYLRVEVAVKAGLPLPCIEVQPLGAAGQGKAIPLASVQLT